MPRPQKKRNVCQMPNHPSFGPYLHSGHAKEKIILLIDEMETIRLIDLEGYNQEEAAKQMNVARTTVQRIYNDARKKIADSIINGKQLSITGGEYVLCGTDCSFCKRPDRLLSQIKPIITKEE